MAKKVRNTDIVEKGLFDPTIKNAEELLIVLMKLEGEFKDILKTTKDIAKQKPFDSFEGLRKTEEAAKKTKQAVEGLDKIEQERLKLQQRIDAAVKERIKNNEKLRKELNNQLNVRDKVIKQNEFLNKSFSEQEEQLSRLTKQYDDLSKEQKENNEEGRALREEIDRLQKAQAERLKLEERLAKATSTSAVENAKLRVAISEANKEAKEAAREALGLNDAYQTQSKRLNDLRKQYKNLAAQNKENTDEAKDLLKEITTLDERLKDIDKTVGQNQRNIGNYASALEGLQGELKKTTKDLADLIANGEGTSKEARKLSKRIKELNKSIDNVNEGLEESVKNQNIFVKSLRRVNRGLKRVEDTAKKARVSLGIFTFIAAAIGSIGGALTQSREGAIQFQKSISTITAGVKVFLSSLGEASTGIFDLFNSLGTRIDIFVTKASIKFLELTNAFGRNNKKLEETREELEKLQKELSDTKGIDDVISAFDDFGDRVDDLVEKQNNLLDTTIAYEIQIQKLEKSLLNLRKQQELSAAIADDDTLSFQRRAQAFEENARINARVAAQETEIASKRLELAAEQARIELLSSQRVQDAIESGKLNISTTEGVIDALENQNFALAASEESANAVQQAFLALGEAQINQANTQFENAQRRRKFISDEEERNLDILIDGFDNQKTINDRIIADETRTFEERRRAAADNERLSKESFDKQIETIRSFARRRIETNNLLTEDEKERQRQLLENTDIESLINEQSAVALNERIRQLELGEIFEGRTLEVVRERKVVNEDLLESNKELARSELESKETNAEILKQREFLNKVIKEGFDLQEELQLLEDARLQNEIDALRKRLELAEEGSEEAIEIERELNEKLIQQQTGRIEKELEAERKAQDERDKLEKERRKKQEEAAKQREEIFNASLEAVSSILQRNSEKQLEQIDNQIEAARSRQEALIELAREGNEEATENLALEQQRQAELEREREARIRRQKLEELTLSTIQVYSSKVESGDPAAFNSTVSDITRLTAFINSLPAFYGGSENVAKDLGVPHLNTNKDQYLIRADGNERILSPSHNAMVPYTVSNLELATLGYLYGSGKLFDSSSEKPNNLMLQKLDQLNTTIQNKPSLVDIRYSEIEKAVIQTIERKGRVERNHHKTGSGIWRR